MQYIYADLVDQAALTADGTRMAFNWLAGQKVSYGLRFYDQDSAGGSIRANPEILGMRAAVGFLDAPPIGGFYRIKIGEGSAAVTTDEITYNSDAEIIEEAMNEVSDLDFVCNQIDGGVLIRRQDGASVKLQVIPEGLKPTSYAKITGGQKFKGAYSGALVGDLFFSAKEIGETGNQISVEVVDAGSLTTTPLQEVLVVGKKITVKLKTTGNPLAPVAKVKEVKQAIEASAAASALVRVAFANALDREGENAASLRPLIPLAGGADPFGGHEYMLALVQAPVAFTNWFSKALPPRPEISKIQAGGVSPDGTMKWNTIMALQVPTDFEGSYQFYRAEKFKRSGVLDKNDTTEAIKRVLDNFMSDEGGAVKVTNPSNNIAHLEFEGEFEGVDVALLEIFVYSAPPPDLAFDLDLSNADLYEALAAQDALNLQFEVEAVTWVDESDKEAGTKTVRLFRETCIIRKALIWDPLSIQPPINWQRRPLAESYMPFSRDQILAGQNGAYTQVIGDGAATIFIIDHGLSGAGEGVVAVMVRQNSVGGRRLRDDEYELAFLEDGEIQITFNGAPALNSLAVLVIGYGAESVFINHTHTIDQIKTINPEDGSESDVLRDVLEDFANRMARLEALIPRNAAALASGLNAVEVSIPPFGEILPDLSIIGGLDDGSSISSQLMVNNSGESVIVPGSELEKKASDLEKELTKIKAEREADKAAQNDAIKKAAEEAAEQAKASILAELSKKSKIITSIYMEGIGSSEIDNQRTVINYDAFPAKRGLRFGFLPRALGGIPLSVSAVPTIDGLYVAGGALRLPASSGRKAQEVAAGEFFGRVEGICYKTFLSGGLYYPFEMERALFKCILQPDQFPAGSEASVSWNVYTAFSSDTINACSYTLEAVLRPVLDQGASSLSDLGALGSEVLLGSSLITLAPKASETRAFSLKMSRLTTGDTGGSFVALSNTYSIPSIPAGPIAVFIRLSKFDLDDSSLKSTGQVKIHTPSTIMSVSQL